MFEEWGFTLGSHTPPNKIKYDHKNNRRLWAKAHWAHSLPSLVTLLRFFNFYIFFSGMVWIADFFSSSFWFLAMSKRYHFLLQKIKRYVQDSKRILHKIFQINKYGMLLVKTNTYAFCKSISYVIYIQLIIFIFKIKYLSYRIKFNYIV